MSTNAAKIVDDALFRADKSSIDVQKIVFKLWENRGNASKLNEISEVLCKFLDEKKIFTEIEFYLPQIVHLVIHMDQHIHSPGLETLAMFICQTSMHCALQFSFMLIASMEDYQPEIARNKKNPNANAFYFSRCARLLQDVERAVIYGSPNFESTSEESCWKNKIKMNFQNYNVGTDFSAHDARTMKRSELAHQLSMDIPRRRNVDTVLNGILLFKRVERKSFLHSKAWHPRYFIVDQRVLLCFQDAEAVTPKRAISLQNCTVIVHETDAKYADTLFEVTNEANRIRYLLRAENKVARDKWVEFLKREISGAPILTSLTSTTSPDSPVNLDNASCSVNNASDSSDNAASTTVNTSTRNLQNQFLLEADMTPAQRRRFRYFQQMRVFVTNLTNICERLRFKEKDVRKFFLRRDTKELILPPFAYLPLCNSVDTFHCLRMTLPKECHAFTTKARVPALMLFEIERHPRGLDVATFLSAELELYDDTQVFQREEQFHTNYENTHGEHNRLDLAIAAAEDRSEEDDEVQVAAGQSQTAGVSAFAASPTVVSRKSNDNNSGLLASDTESFWSEEGTGMKRLRMLNTAVGNGTNNSSAATQSDDISLDFGQESAAILAANPQLPHTGVLGETFAGKAHRLQGVSALGSVPGWSIGGLIAKSNDDVRQEVFVIQLMTYFQRAFAEANVPVWMHTYKIVSTSKSTGLIELIANATSLDGLKKSENYPGKLRLWFEQKFGGNSVDQTALKTALLNYVASQAAYSIVTYLLAIKDRHNGNIMIDKDGHIIHIDFGFVFGLAPGKQFSMETAPWKLNAEFVDVMGGYTSPLFQDYKQRCVQAFTVARRHANSVSTLIEIMQAHSNYPAFRYNRNALKDFRARLFLDKKESDLPAIVDRLISRSYKHSGTDMYDQFQLATNGIAV